MTVLLVIYKKVRVLVFVRFLSSFLTQFLFRSASPSAVEHSGGMSPISSMSSASAPSPSSLSAGSVSPDSTPKKRTGANPNFEKVRFTRLSRFKSLVNPGKGEVGSCSERSG